MEHVILLHGALGSQSQLLPLKEKLEARYSVHTFNLSGHAGKQIPSVPLSIALFASDVLEFMEQNNITSANIFGYSMGGYVAMYLAKYYPEKIKQVITLAAKFYWDEVVASKEIKMLDADTIEKKVPAFAMQLKERHAPNDWRLVLQKTIDMMISLGKNNTLKIEDYPGIQQQCMIMLGDRDKMVSFEETIAVYKQLPNAQLCVLPQTAHPIEQVNVDMLSYMIVDFLK